MTARMQSSLRAALLSHPGGPMDASLCSQCGQALPDGLNQDGYPCFCPPCRSAAPLLLTPADAIQAQPLLEVPPPLPLLPKLSPALPAPRAVRLAPASTNRGPRLALVASLGLVVLCGAGLCALGIYAALKGARPSNQQGEQPGSSPPGQPGPLANRGTDVFDSAGFEEEFETAVKATPPPEPPVLLRDDLVLPALRLEPLRFPLRGGRLRQEGARAKPPRREVPERPAARREQLVRLDNASEEELRRQLFTATEVGLGPTAPLVLNAYVANIRDHLVLEGIPYLVDATPLLRTRPDLGTLPLRHGSACQLNAGAAATMEALSRKLRVYLASVTAPGSASPGADLLRQVLNKEMRGRRPEWLRPQAIPTMMQMLMPEDAPYRQILVDMLAAIPGKTSTEDLARRAVFDLDADVRRSAIASLKQRRPDDYRHVFLQALRYPWPPPAEHAAEALAALDDRAAVPELIMLLKQPDPSLPVLLNNRRAVVRDVVRANHLNNCLLCHPPATTAAEPVLGLDPVVSNPFPTPAVLAAIRSTQSTPGSHGYGGSSNPARVPLLIRGDITFLRQDFSVKQPGAALGVGQFGTAPTRFDYVVRTRYVPVNLAKKVIDELGTQNYPQRDAVLFALRKLTDQDPGTTTEVWLEKFPRAAQDAEAARLSRQLLQASAYRRDVLLNKLRTAKGVVNTMALAVAIPSLEGKTQERARAILEERLTRMTTKTLRHKLQDEDQEVRRAAVAATVRKEKKELVPELIGLLADTDPVMARTAEAALKDLTGKQLPTPAAWREWWQKQ